MYNDNLVDEVCNHHRSNQNFFSVEVLTFRGLVRYVVLFVMKLKTRTVEIAGMTSQPDETCAGEARIAALIKKA
jgi:hypothetical protein